MLSRFLKRRYVKQWGISTQVSALWQSIKLDQHLPKCTKNKSQFQCKFCEQACSSKSQLLRHVQLHKDKPFVCGTCKKKSAIESELNKHQRIHTEEKPYQCEKCNTSFFKTSSLTHDMIRLTVLGPAFWAHAHWLVSCIYMLVIM